MVINKKTYLVNVWIILNLSNLFCKSHYCFSIISFFIVTFTFSFVKLFNCLYIWYEKINNFRTKLRKYLLLILTISTVVSQKFISMNLMILFEYLSYHCNGKYKLFSLPEMLYNIHTLFRIITYFQLINMFLKFIIILSLLQHRKNKTFY